MGAADVAVPLATVTSAEIAPAEPQARVCAEETMNHRTAARVAVAGLGITLSGGCSDHYVFGDNIDFEFDFLDVFDVDEVESRLAGPYAEGTTFAMWALTNREREDLTGFDVVSLDPEILRLEPDASSLLTQILRLATAVAEGEATIQLVDLDGRTVAETTVEVLKPDHVALHAAGPLFADDPTLGTEAVTPTQLAGGLATYQVQYFHGPTRLAGNGLLGAASGAATVEVAQTFFFERREWLAVRAPAEPGDFDVDLTVNGEAFGPVTFEAVDAVAITSVEIFGAPDQVRNRDEGLPEVLLAQSFAGATPVFGVEYDWTVDGADQFELGDLLRYSLAPGEAHDVTATFGDLGDAATVEGTDFEVDSSNNVGCSHAPSAAGLGLAAVGLLLRRRRR